MKYYYLIFTFLFLLFATCSQEPKSVSIQGELIFQSGFEPGSEVVSKGSDADIVGKDLTFSDYNDWEASFDNHPEIGSFSLQYQGGDSTQRFAKIISEPGNPENRVLQFWLNEPNVGGEKGRIQANIYGGKKGLKEFYQSVRIFLPDDFKQVRLYPERIRWLTIAEFWNNITWSQSIPNRFRITLGIGKPVEGESDLYFILDAQDCELYLDNTQKYTTLWSEINKEVKIPIGKWFVLEYYYKEGDSKNGKFYLAIQPEGGVKQVVFDVKRVTHNSKDPNPDGVTDFNPMKLYTSKQLIDYMRNSGKTLQIYWDDFKLWKNKHPE